jgi:hypothetical protein
LEGGSILVILKDTFYCFYFSDYGHSQDQAQTPLNIKINLKNKNNNKTCQNNDNGDLRMGAELTPETFLILNISDT